MCHFCEKTSSFKHVIYDSTFIQISFVRFVCAVLLKFYIVNMKITLIKQFKGKIAQMVERLLWIRRTQVQIQSFPCCSVPYISVSAGRQTQLIMNRSWSWTLIVALLHSLDYKTLQLLLLLLLLNLMLGCFGTFLPAFDKLPVCLPP